VVAFAGDVQEPSEVLEPIADAIRDHRIRDDFAQVIQGQLCCEISGSPE
jgi:hypothetical protein